MPELLNNIKVTDTNSFVRKAKTIHGDRYDYSLAKYINKKTKVIIICKKHGEFFQKPSIHCSGSDCQKCAIKNRMVSLSSFIKRSIKKHGNKYDYSLIKSINGNKQKIPIICKEHGKFYQTVCAHYYYGCTKCGTKIKNNSSFINECYKVHNYKYDYSLVNYAGSNKKITIICSTHGKFTQYATSHLAGRGCFKCADDTKRKSLDAFIKKSRKKHGNKYDYSLSIYINKNTKIKIICHIHGEFKQRPADHYSGGCSRCGINSGRASISKVGNRWLNYLGIHEKYRETCIKIDNKKYRVDAYVPNTNTIYEFNGDFWHGNPEIFDQEKIHPVIKKKYKDIYQKTINKENLFIKNGFKVISIWENDFNMATRKSKTISLVPDKVKKPSGLKTDGTPNSSWRKFKERLESYHSVPVSSWGPDQVLGHLFKRYEDNSNINFSLSYSGPPSKCPEIYCIKRMMSLLDGDNPNMDMIKDFIDWSFDSVIIPKKLQIESLAFFFSQKLVREFKAKYKKSKTITRSTKLPTLVEQIISEFGLNDSISTYGELAFTKKAVDADPDNSSYKVYRDFFNSLSIEGFDYSVLNSLQG